MNIDHILIHDITIARKSFEKQDFYVLTYIDQSSNILVGWVCPTTRLHYFVSVLHMREIAVSTTCVAITIFWKYSMQNFILFLFLFLMFNITVNPPVLSQLLFKNAGPLYWWTLIAIRGSHTKLGMWSFKY